MSTDDEVTRAYADAVARGDRAASAAESRAARVLVRTVATVRPRDGDGIAYAVAVAGDTAARAALRPERAPEGGIRGTPLGGDRPASARPPRPQICGPARALAHGETADRPDPIALAEACDGPDGTDASRALAPRVLAAYCDALRRGESPARARRAYDRALDGAALAWCEGAAHSATPRAPSRGEAREARADADRVDRDRRRADARRRASKG